MKLTTVSLGGGVQSGTIAEMCAEGELPRPDVFIFADTGDEPDYVYTYIGYLARRLAVVGVPVVQVSSGNMVSDLYGGKRFAAMPLFTRQLKSISGFGIETHTEQVGRLRRQCTREYKIEPIERWIKTRLLETGAAKQTKSGGIRVNQGVSVETWLGISLDEVQRMKPSQTKWITHRWPLIEKRMTRQKCQQWLESRGLPIPLKSACKRCPYHDLRYWRDMKDNRPADWQEVVQFDNDLRDSDSPLRISATDKGDLFMTDQCIPLAMVDLSTPQENGQGDICDAGFCFI